MNRSVIKAHQHECVGVGDLMENVFNIRHSIRFSSLCVRLHCLLRQIFDAIFFCNLVTVMPPHQCAIICGFDRKRFASQCVPQMLHHFTFSKHQRNACSVCVCVRLLARRCGHLFSRKQYYASAQWSLPQQLYCCRFNRAFTATLNFNVRISFSTKNYELRSPFNENLTWHMSAVHCDWVDRHGSDGLMQSKQNVRWRRSWPLCIPYGEYRMHGNTCERWAEHSAFKMKWKTVVNRMNAGIFGRCVCARNSGGSHQASQRFAYTGEKGKQCHFIWILLALPWQRLLLPFGLIFFSLFACFLVMATGNYGPAHEWMRHRSDTEHDNACALQTTHWTK